MSSDVAVLVLNQLNEAPEANTTHLQESQQMGEQTSCISIGLLQQMITWYKIRHAGGQAHYYSCTGTLKQRQVKLDWFRSLSFNVPVREQ